MGEQDALALVGGEPPVLGFAPVEPGAAALGVLLRVVLAVPG